MHTKIRYEKRIQELKEMISKTNDELTKSQLEYRIKTLQEFLSNQ